MTAREELVEELHKSVRRNYPRRKVEVRGIDESWQIDLIDMQKYASENKGYNYLLTVIDNVSKYAWTVPIKSETANDVTEAMKTILKKGRVPKNIQGDNGKEFFNFHFKNLMKHYKINLYSTFSVVKASIIERFNRTLKTKMWKLFTLNGNHKWLNLLPTITGEYNKSKHRTIGIRPIDVNNNNEQLVLKRIRQTVL